MRPNTLTVDVLIAVAIAGVVLILSPGVAVAGLVAIAIVIVCGVSAALKPGRRRLRRASRTRRGERRP